jgi:hypothetical protein
MKSFVMAMYLLAVAVGNLSTAAVNEAMVRPLHATGADAGAETWIKLEGVDDLVTGQKIDFGGKTGIELLKPDGTPVLTQKGEPDTLQGTYLVAEKDVTGGRVKLMDVVDRKPVATRGALDTGKAEVSTYKLVGPQYFNFFAAVMTGMGLLFIVVAIFYKEKTHVREEEAAA